MNSKANHFKVTFLGLSDMNEVMGITPCSTEENLHYARVSKVSADSADFLSTSLDACYKNETSHDLFAPGLLSSP